VIKSPVAKVLPIHGLYSCIRSLKAIKANKAKSSAGSSVGISHDLGCGNDHAECAESVVQQLQAAAQKLSYNPCEIQEQA